MTQEDLFYWAQSLYSKYGIKEEQLELPFKEKENKQNETTK